MYYISGPGDVRTPMAYAPQQGMAPSREGCRGDERCADGGDRFVPMYLSGKSTSWERRAQRHLVFHCHMLVSSVSLPPIQDIANAIRRTKTKKNCEAKIFW